jgi:hypothetical protein
LKVPHTSGPDYVFDDIEVRRPLQKIRRTNEVGAPSGQVGIEDWVEGTGTVQLTATAVPIVLGVQFKATFSIVGGEETFVITEVSQPEGKTEDKKMKISFDKVLGTIT